MKKKMINRYVAICLLAALGISGNAARAEILIGAAGPFSGPNASLGEQLKRGVQMAVDDINAGGGVAGDRLAVTFTDDGCDPRKAVDAATGFVSAGAKVIIGHYCSGASIPASKIYASAGIVEISPASTHPKFTDEGGWNVLRLCPRDDAQGSDAAKLVLQHFASAKIAILNDQSASAMAQASRFREGLGAKGVTAVIDENYKPGAKDYSALADTLRNAGIEVLYLAGSYVESGLIAKALRDSGSGAQIVAGDSLVTDDFWNIAKEAGEGTLMSFTYDPRKFPAARTALAHFKDADYNAEGFTLYAYAAVEAWVAAANATGTTDSARIARWLRGGNRIHTAVGEISFNSKGDLNDPRFAWFKWIDGHYAEIDPDTLQLPVLDTNSP